MQRPRKAKIIIKKNEKAGLTLPDTKPTVRLKVRKSAVDAKEEQGGERRRRRGEEVGRSVEQKRESRNSSASVLPSFLWQSIIIIQWDSINESRCITHHTTHTIDLTWNIDPSIKPSKMITFLEKNLSVSSWFWGRDISLNMKEKHNIREKG